MIASGGRGRRARISWALFDWAAQPLYTLLLTFIFGPYFVARVAADAVQGQSLWGAANAAAGIGIAVASPLLGAIADRGGNRKGWIALFSLAAVAGSALLWLAEPQAPGAVVWLVLAAFVVAALGVEYATVFTNSMLPDLAGPGKVGSLSGLGWGVGYVGGLVSLAIMLCFLVTDPQTGRTLAGLEPPSFLAGIPFAGDRASGPFSALWYLVFVLPLFLFVPEARPQAGGGGVSLRRSFADLVASLKSYGRGSPFLRFLVARMIYADGLGALFAFGGVYAATTFGWGATELGLFGILLTFTGAIGAVAGGRADDRYGPRAVVVATLAALIALAIAAFSTTRDSILFVIPAAPGDGGLFGSAAERAYLVIGALIGVVAGPVQSASRTIVTRLAHPGRMTEAFGLFAFSGKATAFIAPAAVSLLTLLSGSQRFGMAAVIVFLAAGLALFLRVPLSGGSAASR